MFLSLDRTKLYTTAFGAKDALPILTLSGWIGTWEDWSEVLALLSEDWRTISYDHRGSGATVAPLETIVYQQLVEDVFTVLDAYQVRQCVLAAMSMGSLVAISALLQQPQRFSGLVIVNGIASRPVTAENDPFLQGLKRNYPAALRQFIEACVPEEDSEHLKRWGRQIVGRAEQEAAVALYRVADGIDLRGDLQRITQPTLIVHGDADPLVPAAVAQQMAQAIPNAQLTLLHGAGHVPIITRPREVAEAIQQRFGRP